MHLGLEDPLTKLVCSAKFAPNKDIADNYTPSPRLHPRDQRNPQRTASVSERIAQRFKEIQRKAVNGSQSSVEGDKAGDGTSTVVFDEKSSITSEPESHSSPSLKPKDEEIPPPPPVDKGKEKEKPPVTDEPQALLSPPPMTLDLPPKSTGSNPASPVPPHPPPPILLAGLALPPAAVSNLLERAAADMNLRPIKFPIIGEYKVGSYPRP